MIKLEQLECRVTPGLIAIIDSGVDFKHSYLNGKIWINKKEIPFNGKDDDKNGFIDDYRGWDFVNKDNNPGDDNGHGTHVSGIARNVGGNSVNLMIIKVLNKDLIGKGVDVVNGIRYAVNNGAKVISLSLGGEGFPALSNIIKWANTKKVIVVAAGGNDGASIKITKTSPAILPNVISVSALSKDGKNLANYSNYNTTIAAPGTGIYSSLPYNKYGRYSGTSMATPYVASAISLLLDKYENYNLSDVRKKLKLTSNFLSDTEFGILNIKEFLK